MNSQYLRLLELSLKILKEINVSKYETIAQAVDPLLRFHDRLLPDEANPIITSSRCLVDRMFLSTSCPRTEKLLQILAKTLPMLTVEKPEEIRGETKSVLPSLIAELPFLAANP